MTILQAFFFGLVQGLTELLPISSSLNSSVNSSGHLLLLQNLWGIQDFSLWIKILLHAGTLVAVIAVYWRKLWEMIRYPLQSELIPLLIATVPTIAIALLTTFDDAFAAQYIGWSFLITTLILWFGGLIASVAPQGKYVKWYHGLFMGIMQAVSTMLPGVSRTASAIAGGSATGLARRQATDFSFLMIIPTVVTSLVFTLQDVMGSQIPFAEDPLVAVVAFASSTLFGCVAIQIMRGLMHRIKLSWFGVYTGILGVLILLDQYFLHFFF